MSRRECRRAFAKSLLLLGFVCGAGVVGGRSQERAIDQAAGDSTDVALRQMTLAAGVIFAGEVVAVRRPEGFAGSPQAAAEGVVEVEFRVDQAVRGCTSGSIYTLREWAGLWTGGDRYHKGERLLVFLHGADGTGLNSPVGGAAGLVPLRGGGRSPGPYDSDAAASGLVVDLRWVQSRVPRVPFWLLEAEPTRGVSSHTPRGQERAEVAGREVAYEDVRVIPSRSPGEAMMHRMAFLSAEEPATRALSVVLSQCRGWMGASDGAF